MKSKKQLKLFIYVDDLLSNHIHQIAKKKSPWWRHQMEALPVPGQSPSQMASKPDWFLPDFGRI